MEYSIWNIPSGIWTANGISFATPGRTVFANTVPQFPSLQTYENTSNILALEKLPQSQISSDIIPVTNTSNVQQSDSESNEFSDHSQNSEIESESIRTITDTELPEICNENDNATDTITNFNNYFNLNQIKIENPLAFINQQFNPVYNLMINHLNTKSLEHNNSDSEDAKKDQALTCNNSQSSDKLDTDTYHCTICNIAVCSEVELRTHMKSFHLPSIYEQTQTNDDSSRYSSNSNNTTSNVLIAETIDNSTSSGRKRKTSGTLGHHRIRYMREEYRCTLCTYTCTIEKAFYRHLRAHSATGSNEGDTDFTTPRVSCAICGKDRSSEVDMTKHMKKHRDNRFFCCDICVFRTVQLKKLIQHRRMHTGEKPHLCPFCVYRSARRDNLRSHVRRVHKEDRLVCDTFSPRGLMMTPTAREINAVVDEDNTNQA